MKSTVPHLSAHSSAQYANRPCFWVFDVLAGSQGLIKLHERFLRQVFRKSIVCRRPECITDERHVPAIKERRYQIGCIIFVHDPGQPTRSSCLCSGRICRFSRQCH